MEYRWDDFSLDREGALLMRQGRQVDVSRKVLECICHLIEQRHRVVSYDELIRKLWGHDNVTNHQLAQVVLSARRTLGDDGQAQRLIRTMPGLGYRWVKTVLEGTDPIVSAGEAVVPAATAATPASNDDDRVHASMRHTPDPENLREGTAPTIDTPAATEESISPSSTPAQADAATPMLGRIGRLRLWAAATIALAVFATIAWWFQDKQQTTITGPLIPAATSPLARIEERLWRGDVEAVRAGLTALPMELNDSPDARILEIRMYIENARYDRAAQKLEVQQARSRASADPVWQAKLLTLQSTLTARRGTLSQEVFEPARDAVALLETIGDKAPPSAVGEAIAARGSGYLRLGQFEPAIRDLVHARDILLKAGNKRSATNTRHMLAYAWLRMGRLENALDEFEEVARLFEQLQHPRGEVDARNSATRLQIELLRWDEASVNSRRSMDESRKIADSYLRTYTIRLHALVQTHTGHLREAASLLEETDISSKTGSGASITYYLASGKAESALSESAAMFANYDAISNSNLILSNQEGALLFWVTAAQELEMARGEMPAPTDAQLEVLQHPMSIPGRIARGRWLRSKGMLREAKAELRLAFEDATKANRLFYMTLAAVPLIGLELENGDVETADMVLASLRGIDPERMDRDYQVSVLQLRIAFAKGDTQEIEDTHTKVLALAGERALPAGLRGSEKSKPEKAVSIAKGMP